MLSNIKAIVPENLIQLAKKTPKVPVAIVCAHQESVIESAKQAYDLNLIDPILLASNRKLLMKQKKLIGILIILKLLTVKMIKTLQLKQQVLLKKIK